jgi:small redox-active disulfide protein 2
MEIKILGTGCPKCKKLEEKTRQAVNELGIEANIEKVEDIMKIMEYGVMSTPGLVIDGKVVFSGRLPSSKELNDLLTSK